MDMLKGNFKKGRTRLIEDTSIKKNFKYKLLIFYSVLTLLFFNNCMALFAINVKIASLFLQIKLSSHKF